MPTDGWGPALRMLAAFGLAAVVAMPVGLIAWRLGRRTAPPSLPAPTADDPVVALGYVLLFLVHPVGVLMFGQAATATGLLHWVGGDTDSELLSVWRSLLGTLLMAPVLLVAWLGFRATCGAAGSWQTLARAVAVGVAGWLLVSPAVYAVHAGAEWANEQIGFTPQEHPLVKLARGADARRALLLFAAVTVATPFAEEVVFRGLLLGWLVRRPACVVVPLGLAVVVAIGTADGQARLFAGGLLAVLCIGLVALRQRPTMAAVWATSTLFAAVHSSVWPTPVPLFLLGLTLGVVAVRTGGVLAGTVLHGLFNAVSLVYLLRG